MNENSQQGEVTALIERWLSLEAQGLQVSVDEICREAPHLIDPVKRELGAIRDMNRLLESQESELPQLTVVDQNKVTLGSKLGRREGVSQTVNSYQLQKLHGHGGCSEVYLATDLHLGRTVAVKFLRPDTENIESYRKRLEREAKITSRLDHPGVVSIHSVGQDERGLPFYTMRFVDGNSLADAIKDLHNPTSDLKSQGVVRASLRKLINHFVDVCQTIAFAHDRDVIHRDLKPANIVIGSFGETYVIDWGLAKKIGEDDDPTDPAMDETQGAQQLTRVGHTLGTPAFMSPEQAVAKQDVGKASDIFSLGATLYAILVGSPPYDSASLIDNVRQAEKAQFVPPRERNREVPPALDAVCRKAMALDPAERYQTAQQLADEVERFLADQSVEAYRDPITERLRRWVMKNRTLVSTVATTAAVALILLTLGNTLLFNANRMLAISEDAATTAFEEAMQSLYSQRIALASSELNKNNIVRAEKILDNCLPQHREWEWRLLSWMVNRHKPLTSLAVTGRQIKTMALSPDGKFLAAGSDFGEIKIWGIDDWDHGFVLEDGMNISSVAFSPDGTQLAVCGSFRSRAVIHLWDLASRTRIAQRDGGSAWLLCLAYSADGSAIVTGGDGGQVKIRNSQTLIPIERNNDAHRDRVTSVAFNSSGEHVISSGSDGKIRLWNLKLENLDSTTAHSGAALSLAAANNQLASTGSDSLIQLREFDSSEPISERLPRTTQTLAGHSDHVLTSSLSPDGKYLASGGLDRIIRIWDLNTAESIALIRRHSSHIRSLIFHPNGKYLFSAGDDKVVNVWDVKDLIKSTPSGTFVKYCGDKDHLIVADDNKLTIWDAVNRKPVVRSNDHPSQIVGLSASNSDAFATLYRNGITRVWNSQNGQLVAELGDKRHGAAYAAVFADDGATLCVGHQDGTVQIFDVASASLTHQIQIAEVVYRMAIDPAQEWLMIGKRNGELEIWSIATRKLIHTIDAHMGEVLALSSHPTQDLIASTGSDGVVRVWNLKTAELVMEMESGASWLHCIEFTPDGKRIISGNEHTITCWSSESGKEVLSFALDRCVHHMSFSSDGRRLALAGAIRDGAPRKTQSPPIRIFETGK